MTREELIQTARASVEAYNEKDWEAAREALSPDIVYDEVASNRRVEGTKEVLNTWRGWAKAFPDSKGTIEEERVDGDTVVFCLRWRGTHSGPLSLPTGEILPTQKKIDVRGCQVIRLEDDVAVEITHYFDMLTMLSQLGEVAGMPETKAKARPKAR